MEISNGNCSMIYDESDDDDDISSMGSPLPPRRAVPSPPLPPRRPSPLPTPNNHTRNSRHLTVPKENAPPPPFVTVLTLSDSHQNSKGTMKWLSILGPPNFSYPKRQFGGFFFLQQTQRPDMTCCIAPHHRRRFPRR